MTHPKQVVVTNEPRNPSDIKRWQASTTTIADRKYPTSFEERYPLMSAPDTKCEKCGRRIDVLVTSHGCVGSAESVI